MKQPKTLPIKSAAPIGIGFEDRFGGGALYSVVRTRANHAEEIVAEGLSYLAAKKLSTYLEIKFREETEAAGKHYSSWTADLYHCQKQEPPNAEFRNAAPTTTARDSGLGT